MNYIDMGAQFLALALFAWPTGAFAQQASMVAGNVQVSGMPAAVAQVPRLVKFSGAVRDASGKPVSSMAGITFALYQDQEGGPPLWTENQNVQPDAAGHYAVWLGATKNDGVPVELFASGQARWLGVQVEGQPEQTRVLLVSVPYALKAGDADTLGGKPASAYLLVASSTSAQPEGRSGVAQGAQTGEAAVSAKPVAGVKPALTSSGSTNWISKFTDATGDIGNSVMYQNGSNIGVGTTAGAISMDIRPTATSPYAQLGVAQTVDYMTLFASDTYGPAFYWDPAKALRFGKGGAGLYSATGFVEYMRIQPNGYVGIGTQTPAATLEVKGNAQVDGNLTLSGSIFTPGSTVPVIQAPTNGSNNFSAGLGALPPGTTGTYDTAVGDNALHSDTTGYDNTAVGGGALYSNTTGGVNTAIGEQALYSNTTGGSNTATGFDALDQNTTGYANTASGALALFGNTVGCCNTASGDNALYHNTTGINNTAMGTDALWTNSTGSNNIAIGDSAGYNVTSTSNNIDIGNQGSAADSGVIRIGAAGTQTSAFIAGIRGVTTGNNNAVPVLIDSNGQLGTVSSSRRYKEDIQDMADASSGLMRLRPVTFRYKKPFDDGSKPMQYGLIAEEVGEVYPDLVARSADGQVETVKYQLLDSMLLNEVQKQNTTIAAQKEQIRAQEQQIRSLEERLAKLEAALAGTTVTTSSR